MTPDRLDLADFGMDTQSMAGGLAQRLQAVRGAGFSQVMLSAADLVEHADGIDAAVRLVRASGLRITGLQVLRDFEGLAGRPHAHKVDVAKSLLEMCRAVGSPLLLAAASGSAHASGEPEAAARDLRKLAMLAVPLGVRIGYAGLAWARHVTGFDAAWDIVCRADAPNLGLVIDAAQVLATQSPLEDLDYLDPGKLFLVRLADVVGGAADSPEQRVESVRRTRVFPGEGLHTEQLAELVLRLSRLGYRGDYSFDAVDDDHRQIPPATVAAHARRAAIWLGEDVLHLSVPLPGQMRLRKR